MSDFSDRVLDWFAPIFIIAMVGLFICAVGAFVYSLCTNEGPAQTKLFAELPNGCKVYEIKSRMETIYTTTCKGSVEWTVRSGKTTRQERVETEERK